MLESNDPIKSWEHYLSSAEALIWTTFVGKGYTPNI